MFKFDEEIQMLFIEVYLCCLYFL